MFIVDIQRKVQNPAVGRKNPMPQNTLGAKHLESPMAEKRPVGPGGYQVECNSVLHPHSNEANSSLGCMWKSVASRSRELILLLKGGYKEDRDKLFSVVSSARTITKWHKL